MESENHRTRSELEPKNAIGRYMREEVTETQNQKGELKCSTVDERSNSELLAHWRLLVAATIGTGLGFPSLAYYTIGIFAPDMTHAFGWSFASIFSGLVVIAGTLLVGGPVAGLLVDRYGARRVAIASLVGLGISYMTLCVSTGSLLQYYASWIAIGVTGVGSTFVPFTKAVNSAFRIRRGFALGVILSGTGLFILVVKPFANWLLLLFGWRWAIVGVSILPIIIGVSAVHWGFPKNKSTGQSKASNFRATQATHGLTLKAAMSTRAFWLMICILVPISFASAAPFPNMENILLSIHVDTRGIIELTSWVGAMMIVGRLAGGLAMDYIWAPLVGIVFLLGAAIGSWLLALPTVTSLEASIAITLLGLAAGLEGGLMSFLAARYFGLKHYGIIYGVMFGVFAIGAAVGPSVFGYVYDRMGSYEQILTLCAGLFAFSAVLLVFLGPYPELARRYGGEQLVSEKPEGGSQ